MSTYYKRSQDDYELVAGAMNKASTSIYDDQLSSVSENAVQNKVVTAALNQNRELALDIRSAKQDKELSEDIEYGDSTYHTVEDTLNALADQSVTHTLFTQAVTDLESEINSKQDTIQVTVMPDEGEEHLIYQYVGETAGDFIHGLFYEYSDNEWNVVSVSPAPVKTTDIETDSFIYVNKDGYIPLDFNPDNIPTTWTLIDGTTANYEPDKDDYYYINDGSYHKIEQAQLHDGVWTVLANGWNDWPEDGIYTPKTVVTVTTDEDKYAVDTSETINTLYQKKELSESIGDYTTVEGALSGLASAIGAIDTELKVYEVDSTTIGTIRPTENAFILRVTNGITSGQDYILNGSYVMSKHVSGAITSWKGLVTIVPAPTGNYSGTLDNLAVLTLYESGSFSTSGVSWKPGNVFWLDQDFKGIAEMFAGTGHRDNIYWRGRWAAGDYNGEYGESSSDGWYMLGTGDDPYEGIIGMAFSTKGVFSIKINVEILDLDLDDTDWEEWANNTDNVKITKLASDTELQELKAKVEELESEVPIEYTVNGTANITRYYKVTVNHITNPTGTNRGYLGGVLNIVDRKGAKFCIPVHSGYYRNDTAYWFPGYERNTTGGTARLQAVAWCGYEAEHTTSFIVRQGQWDNDSITFENCYNNYNTTTGRLNTTIEVEDSTEAAFNAATEVYFRDVTRPHQKSITAPAASNGNWHVFKFSQGAITNGQLPILVGTYSGGYYNTFIVNRFDSYAFNDRANWISNIVCSDATKDPAYIAFYNQATVQTTYTFTEMGNFNMEVQYVGAQSTAQVQSLLGLSTIENSMSSIRRRILFDATTATGATLTTTRDLFGLEGTLDVCGWNTSGNSYRNRYFLSYNPRNNGPVIKLMQAGLGEVSADPVTAISATRSGTEVTLSITVDSSYNIGTAVRFDAD